MNALKILFQKRPSKLRWIFLIAAIPFILAALAGYEYGAFFIFMIPACLCLVQFFFPTVFLWACFFFLFLIVSMVYTFVLVLDIYLLQTGTSSVLLDADDTLVFILILAFLWGITGVLFIIKPFTIFKRHEE